MNVLITSASRKVSLVKTFKKALAKNIGGKVIAADINPLSPALYFADEYLMLPPSKNPEFIDSILDICQDLSIDLIIPTRDEELILFANNKSKFADYGTVINVSSPESIKTCQDKELFLKFCSEHGFKTPQTFANIDELDNVKFPLFIKPKVGKGGLQTFRVDSQPDLDLIMNLVDEPILQKFIDAPEYTIDLFADFSGQIISAVPRQRISVWGGESLVTRTFKNKIIIEETIRLAEELDLIGHNTIQCFYLNEEVIFIEVNPRFGGAASLSFAAGANSPEFLIKLVQGIKLTPRIYDFKDEFIALRYVEDLYLEQNSLNLE